MSQFKYVLQFHDISAPKEVDPSHFREYPASDLLQSIAGQNLKGAAFDVLQMNQERARRAEERNQAFWELCRQTGMPAAHVTPMVAQHPELLGPGANGRPSGQDQQSLLGRVTEHSRRVRLDQMAAAEQALHEQAAEGMAAEEAGAAHATLVAGLGGGAPAGSGGGRALRDEDGGGSAPGAGPDQTRIRVRRSNRDED